MVVVTPTLKAARVAEEQLGAAAFTSAWLVHQHGFRWDDDGHWSRDPVPREDLSALARLLPGDLLLVDEAGMLDQDIARALLTIADETRRGSRSWVTATSFRPSAAAACSTTPPAGHAPRPASSSRPCTGSPTPSTPT